MTFVFQTDSNIVKQVYDNNNNYLIEYADANSANNICAIYFSSHEIYYPNSEDAFKKRIVEKNAYEWYGTRIENAYKHIFIRDIQKQWYLEGINEKLNTVAKLFELLQEETKGFKVTTIGSSAGGYAAVLFGIMLKAERVLSFNGQMMLSDLLETSDESINPIVFRNFENPLINQYFSLKGVLKDNRSNIFYFCSKKSSWDYNQYLHIKGEPVKTIFFNTAHHGIPFLKNALTKVINSKTEILNSYAGKIHSSIGFSINVMGLTTSLSFLFRLLLNKYLKK
ncbi:hypothetical protein [Mucilaginibacter sp. HD30]